ncbi:potassium/proton antiporter [Kordiimonas aestuarii]|uniref:potassium/proton antiporter n=1 Tax=Kordiimonas aestuarii TaxID=1005925 RepID=UPI0021D17D49|nr:potassium/proton antiporter [Kordiimonas aestuarii]
MEVLLFALTGIAVLSILLVPLSSKVQAPILLLFLGLGMVLGEDGPGRIDFSDFSFAYSIGSLCLAIILLSGGFDTRLRDMKVAGTPAGILATLGVVFTALIVGVAYHLILDAPLAEGLLLGAVVGSTDAAATFMLLTHSGVRLRPRLKETLFIESGLNDPIAIFLTLTFVAIVDSGAALEVGTLFKAMPNFVQQMGIGSAAGVAVGYLATWTNRKITLPTGLNSPFFLMCGLFTYSATALAGGSGFLAAYLFGVTVANAGGIGARAQASKDRTAHFHEGFAWLAQIAMFVMLGLLVTPSELHVMLLPGILLAIVLIFFARPAAVFLCLAPLGFTAREKLYIGWVGLRGAVPIFLSIIPVISDGPLTPHFFNLVFIMVVASLLVQGWSIGTAGRVFGVTLGQDEPAKETADA